MQAVREARREKYVAIVGQDCIPEALEEMGEEDSPLIGSVSHEAQTYGPRLIHLGLAILGGQRVAPYNYVEHKLVTASQARKKLDQYFAAAFIPDDAQNAALVTLHNALDIPKDPKKPNPQDTVKVDILGAAVGNLKGPTAGRLFVGPKTLNVLESVPVTGMASNVEPDLRQLVDFGWLGLIARPLFIWLRWTYEHMVNNWGWAIAIQTLIINLAMLPLRISQMKSALKMQKVAPQIKAIQEKYKKYSMRDPRKQEMNQEVAALYKQEGVNPVGGCLPLLIQMPFLFAYYRMLGVAIDLRHAHWLWISDLSAPDPWHILPIAVIITMLITQRMTPQAGMDPSQQKMMNLVMPVMLGVISWNLAAGLCLYWSEGSLIGIVQQAVMNKTALGREMREMMAKRARKKDK